jgi:hypothetical protein
MKRKFAKGIPDEWAFKNLKVMTIKQEHREMLGKFLAAQGMKIAKGKTPITFEEVFSILKETIVQTKKLKEHYDKGTI